MIDKGWNLYDLSVAVHEKTGMYCSSAYLSHILSGRRNPPKIIKAIRDILGIEEDEHEQGA